MLLANSLNKHFLSFDKIEDGDLPILRILRLFDDDKRNHTANAFSIQNVVEVGLQEHGRLPGEWYGVSKMNEIFKTINQTYNFDQNLSDNIMG